MKNYKCLGHDLKVCILFEHNPQVMVCYFVHKMKVPAEENRYQVFCVCNSSYSFTSIPLILYRCLCQGLKMCILFGYNHQIILLLFSQNELSDFSG